MQRCGQATTKSWAGKKHVIGQEFKCSIAHCHYVDFVPATLPEPKPKLRAKYPTVIKQTPWPRGL
jgi:hypothetical protein